MRTRKEILNELSDWEDIEDFVNKLIDEFEGEVGECHDLLDSITRVENLSNVEECRDTLKQLKTDLY